MQGLETIMAGKSEYEEDSEEDSGEGSKRPEKRQRISLRF